MASRLHIGDVRAVMAAMPDASVDLIVTSPPFLALRSYLPADHPDKALEIGSEATPAEFLDVLLALTAEWRRLLTPHGSIAVELGDTYAGSGGSGGDYGPDGLRAGQPRFRQGYDRRDGRATMQQDDYAASLPAPSRGKAGWPLDKCLTFIPELYGVALAYGINPLTGAESPAGRWRVRNKVAWCRPNPPVGALGDKFRPGTSYITVATVARDRWFDLEELRSEPSPNTHARTATGVEQTERLGKSADRDGNWGSLPELAQTAGAPPLDWWNIPTQPYKGAHYATFPEELPRRLILAMCPTSVCQECGKPRRRIVANTEEYDTHRKQWVSGIADGKGAHSLTAGRDSGVPAHLRSGDRGGITAQRDTLGWTDCGCCCGRCDACDPPIIGGPWPCRDKWRPGIVLDPFAGSGTTLAVAQGLGRDSIGIDLDARNVALATARVGMFLTVEAPRRATTEPRPVPMDDGVPRRVARRDDSHAGAPGGRQRRRPAAGASRPVDLRPGAGAGA